MRASCHTQGGQRAAHDALQHMRQARQDGYLGPLPTLALSSFADESRAQGGETMAEGAAGSVRGGETGGGTGDGSDARTRKAVMEQGKQQVAEAILLLDRVHRGVASPYASHYSRLSASHSSRPPPPHPSQVLLVGAIVSVWEVTSKSDQRVPVSCHSMRTAHAQHMQNKYTAAPHWAPAREPHRLDGSDGSWPQCLSCSACAFWLRL